MAQIEGGTDEFALTGRQLGIYQVQERIGMGGMGEVYRAHDTRLNRDVAVKVLRRGSPNSINDPSHIARFRREAQLLATLNHPHIGAIYGFETDGDRHALILELVEGDTLADRLRFGPIPLKDTILIAGQVAEALDAAHCRGIVHRDLKPANIKITPQSVVKVLDFGLAKAVSGDSDAAIPLNQRETVNFDTTEVGMILGTPAYMSPEQARGEPIDKRTDLWAFGCVLYQMLTGRSAFGRDNVIDTLAAIVKGEPDLEALPPETPTGVRRLLNRCLEKDPRRRLRDIGDGIPLLHEKDPSLLSAASEPRWHSFVWPAIAAVSTVLLFSLALVHFREAAPRQAVVSSTILPPAATSFAFATNLGPMSLSPEGKRMVFAATGQDGTSQLWIRSLDSPTAQRLPGTDGAAFPFWSPDGLWVAFFADGKLKKVDTRGGSPIALAEVSASTGYGGSWSAKGEIVYGPAAFTPLRKVSQEGGETKAAVDYAGGNGFPWFLPDGEHFLFAAWAGSGHVAIRVGSLSSTNSTVIAEADSNATYAAGRLLYMRGTSLMAQPFDLKSLRMSGEAEPVAEGVERFLDLVTVGAFTASNSGLLAYQTGPADARKQLTWFDRTGKRIKTLGDPRAFFSIELSPDGRTLAASAPDALGNFDLWLYDVASGLPTRYTSDPGGEFYGVWSPDSRSIILNTTRKGHYDLYRGLANSAGTEEALYTNEMDKVPTSWSSDGKSLLYFTGGSPRNELFVLPLTMDRTRKSPVPQPFLKTTSNEMFGQFSPDGRWVVYSSDLSGQSEIYVTPFSRPGERHRISTNGGGRPRWRRDGKELYYVALDGKLMATETRISELNLEAGPPQALLTITGYSPFAAGYPYDVSEDGQRILTSIPVGGAATQPVTLVQNFTGALKK
ncbi:MAG: serine/threonine-protein kinase [Acidobacteria bacterium]|nr:serine/threonine-protein kinase [Acidobacteriota bacterium]